MLQSVPRADRCGGARDCLHAAAAEAWKRLLGLSVKREVLKEGYR
jgi:hypothetical protein